MDKQSGGLSARLEGIDFCGCLPAGLALEGVALAPQDQLETGALGHSAGQRGDRDAQPQTRLILEAQLRRLPLVLASPAVLVIDQLLRIIRQWPNNFINRASSFSI